MPPNVAVGAQDLLLPRRPAARAAASSGENDHPPPKTKNIHRSASAPEPRFTYSPPGDPSRQTAPGSAKRSKSEAPLERRGCSAA